MPADAEEQSKQSAAAKEQIKMRATTWNTTGLGFLGAAIVQVAFPILKMSTSEALAAIRAFFNDPHLSNVDHLIGATVAVGISWYCHRRALLTLNELED